MSYYLRGLIPILFALALLAPVSAPARGLVLVDIWPEDHPREGRPDFTVADLFEAWGMFSTEDGADDPTPTLEDPTERGIDWPTEPDLSPESSACVVEVIDQPVSVQDEDGSGAAYLGGCEIVSCPDADPVTTCCAAPNVFGVQTCQTVDPTSELYPYEVHTSIWSVLEDMFTLPGSEEVPAGWEGPWRYYMYVSAMEGR